MGRKQDILAQLEAVIAARLAAGAGDSYVASLAKENGLPALKKVEEEAIELIAAAKSAGEAEITHEAADLLFHVLVVLGLHEIAFDRVLAVLEGRFGVSGFTEKALRRDGDSG